jgi:hypothetical protein
MATTAVGLTLENVVRAVAGSRRVERIGSSVADSTDDEPRATRERRERAPHQLSCGEDPDKKQEDSDEAEAATSKGHGELNEHIETTAAGTHAKSARWPKHHATAPEPGAHAAAGHQRREEQERRNGEERRQRGRSGRHDDDDERQEATGTAMEETSRHDGGEAQKTMHAATQKATRAAWTRIRPRYSTNKNNPFWRNALHAAEADGPTKPPMTASRRGRGEHEGAEGGPMRLAAAAAAETNEKSMRYSGGVNKFELRSGARGALGEARGKLRMVPTGRVEDAERILGGVGERTTQGAHSGGEATETERDEENAQLRVTNAQLRVLNGENARTVEPRAGTRGDATPQHSCSAHTALNSPPSTEAACASGQTQARGPRLPTSNQWEPAGVRAENTRPRHLLPSHSSNLGYTGDKRGHTVLAGRSRLR